MQFAQQMFLPAAVAYTIAVLAPGAYATVALLHRRRRVAHRLSAPSAAGIAARALLLVALLSVVVAYLDTDRGVDDSFVLFVVLVVGVNYLLTRTRWGRAVYAVGGNVEAARRAGIRVERIYVQVFILCSVLSVVGGLLAAGRLTSASLQSGGGDTDLNAIASAVIGGTSLFGGRGNAYSALLGIIVIQSISSGLTLLNLDSSVRYMITGAVLLLAVAVDSLSRKSRAMHGRA